MLKPSVAVLVLGLSLTCLAAGAQSRDDILVLQGGTLIDGTGAAPVPDAVVVMRGNRIQAAGPRARVSVPPNAKVISVTGKYIIPGLIDAHVHYWDWLGELLLYHGVTTAIDMGNFSDYMAALADSIEKGWDVGPRIFSSGEFLRGTRPITGSLQAQAFPANEQDTRQWVRDLMAKKMKFIKVMQDMPIAHVAAAVNEAAKFGVPVVGHSDDPPKSIEAGVVQLVHDSSIVGGAIKDPVKRRAFEEESVPCFPALMDSKGMDELIGMMVKHSVYYSPVFVPRYAMFAKRAAEHERSDIQLFARNELQYVPMDVRQGLLSNYHRLRNQRRSGKVPEPGFTWADEYTAEEMEDYRGCFNNAKEFLRRFVAAGGKVNTGTDTPSTSVPGAGLLHEMEIQAEAGMTPMQVLQATTINTARLFHLDKDLGTIEAGKLADVVVLGADPLADISNAQTTETVIKNGKVVSRTFHKEYDTIIKRPMDRVVHWFPELYRPSTFFRRGIIHSLKPGMTTEGSADIEIVVEGIGFSGSSVARIGTSLVKTKYLDPEHLSALIPARLLRVAGTLPVTVESPAPGGGTSNTYGFVVRFK
jgi:hypothetical protein